MSAISDYLFLEKIGESRFSERFRARRRSGEEARRLMVTRLTSISPSPADIALCRQIIERAKSISGEGIVRPEVLIDSAESIAVVYEDCGGKEVRAFMEHGPFQTERFLPVAEKLAGALGRLHQAGLIHRDLRPEHLLLDDQETPWITDFGITKILTKSMERASAHLLPESFLYLSPEETGRMNHAIDSRADIYSLGVIFYEMLSGDAPFRSSDPLEVIHGHIAMTPRPLNEKNPRIPSVLSAIIMKMMEKIPEERYQNAFGVQYDLMGCRERLEKQGAIQPFPLARQDIPIRYTIPQILVGREREKAILLEKLERAFQGSNEMVLVNGAPGIGKSALIAEMERAIGSKKGFFIWGKYDQYRRDVPLSALIQAFTGLIKRIVSSTDEQIALFRERAMAAVGQNGKIVTDLIPLSEIIIGAQPPLPEMDTEERKKRFERVFKNFISVFATEEHPLTIFLDDLQWADLASIAFFDSFMADQNLRFLLTIGSYRKEEVPALHPLQIMLNGINARGKQITVVELGPLSVTETHRIITNILKSDDENALSLAAIVHEKTFGNPFFINQFMKSLYEEAIISHDIHQGWRMDLDRIRKEQVTDNVVALLSNKIQKLPKPVIDILKICACIGNRYELDTLSRVMGKALPETIALLSAAVGEGYIAIHEDMYRFQHDRIEEAVYSLIPEGEKKKRHYEIGKIILEHTSEEELPRRVMYIASHLNHGKEHLTAEERALCARLNLMAGEKSIKSNAYASGRVYLRAGADLLDESAWETDYSLAYSLHKSLMQCGYLSSHFEEAEQIFEMAVERARSVIDKVDLYILMVHLKSVRGEFEEAIRLGFKGFQIIGSLDLNEKTSLEGLIAEYEKTKNLVNALEQEGISLEEIHLFPDKDDPLILRTIKLIGYVSTPAIVINPLLAATIALKPLNFILSHRAVFVRSSYTFPAAGAIICGIFKDYDLGCRIGHVGLHFSHTVTQFFLIYSNCIVHWNAHVNETMDYLAQGYRFGMEIGQTDVAALCLASLFRLKLLLGENLDFTYQELCQYDPILDNDDNPFIVSTIQVLKSFYLGMKQATPPFFNDSDILQLRQGGKSLYYLNALLMKLVLHYLVDDDMERCHEICQEANAFSHNWLATATMPEYYLFYSLVLAAKIADPEKDRALTDELRKNEALFKTWAGLSPVNYHHRHLLVQAELARVEKRFLDAELFYHQAITRAAAVNFLHHEALSSECAGRFYLKRGLTDIARMHLRHAYGCYNRWGAAAKCRRLETLHPEMFPKELEGGFREEAGKFSEKGAAAPQLSLDIRSILKASQTISQEISLKNLFSTLIRIVMENAGAEKGVILLEENGHFLIEAMGTLKQGPLSLPESIPFEASEDLSKAIVTYVIRTREYLILDHAAVIGNFTSDPYVRKTAPKSILCLPIVHQGRLTGILYLENTLTTGAFTEERLEVLRLLSSQMAISIENAKLYQTVEKKVAERTAQLKEAMASLMIAKDELWGEMQLAKRIQRALLPKEPVIPGYDIAAHMESSLEVGGDYYDVIRQNGIHWVIIGDVSGHGVSAGLVMMMVQTALHTALSGDSTPSPSALLETVNTTLFHNMKALGEDKYMTLTLFAVHEGGEIFFAGLHQDIMIYRAEKREVETIETKGFWIGITSDIRGMMPVGRFSMDIGDTLLVFTDGLTEAVLNRDSRKNPGGSREPFGEEKLKALLQERCHGRSPIEIKEEILKALEAYDRGDDLTILLLKRISS